MTATIADIEAVLNQLRMDLTNAQAKLMVGALPLPKEAPKWNCELCVGGLAFATEEKLRAHQVLVHREMLEDDPEGGTVGIVPFEPLTRELLEDA